MAVDKGDANAMNLYGQMQMQWIFDGVRYFKMALDKGNMNAMCNYAVKLYKGDDIKSDKKEDMNY